MASGDDCWLKVFLARVGLYKIVTDAEVETESKYATRTTLKILRDDPRGHHGIGYHTA